MKFNKIKNETDLMVIEISFFHLVPFIACVILIIGPIVGAVSSKHFFAIIPSFVILPLGLLFMNFLMAKLVITINRRDNFLEVQQKSIIKTTQERFVLSDLLEIKLVMNAPVRQGATRSLEFSFKNRPPFKALGSNLSRKEVQIAEAEIAQIKKFIFKQS